MMEGNQTLNAIPDGLFRLEFCNADINVKLREHSAKLIVYFVLKPIGNVCANLCKNITLR